MPGLAGTAAAFERGGQFAEDLIRDKRARKDVLADEERRTYVASLYQQRDTLATKINSLGPKATKEDRDALVDLESNIHRVYHPLHNPGALQKDWHWLKGLITRQKPAPANVVMAPSPDVTITPPAETVSLGAEDAYKATLKGATEPGLSGQQPITLPPVPIKFPGGKVATPTSETMAQAGKVKGLVAPGTLPIWNRPIVENADGSHSSEYSFSFTDENPKSKYYGKEVLVPVIANGKFLTPDGKKPEEGSDAERAMQEEAKKRYQQTGEHLGVFNNYKQADKYAGTLHTRGERPQPSAAAYAPKLSKYDQQLRAERDEADKRAALDIAAAGLGPEEQARIKARAAAVEVREAVKNANQMWDEDPGNANATEEDRRNAHYENFRRIALGITGNYSRSGKADVQTLTLSDGTKATAQWDAERGTWAYMSGEAIPATLLRGATIAPKPGKKVKAGNPIPVARSAEAPQGFAQIWVDPTDPQNKTLWAWTPASPVRYQQSILSQSESTDPLTGLITKTLRKTGPAGQPVFDLTGIGSRPESYSGEESIQPQAAPAAAEAPSRATPPAPQAAPQAAPQPAATAPSLKSQVPYRPIVTDPSAPVGSYNNPLPLDSAGHIPESAKPDTLTPQQWVVLRSTADRLLDGATPKELAVPDKLGALAQGLASQYGWEQGLFTPKDKLLIREAGTYLKTMRNAKSLSVLENKWSLQKINNAITAADDKGGFWSDEFAMLFNLNPAEADFTQRFLQARGTVGGLTQLTRGGRTTEAGIKRLMAELPNPKITHSVKTAQMQLDRLLSEIDVAQRQGFIADVEPDNQKGESRVDAINRALKNIAPAKPSPAPAQPQSAGASNMKPGGVIWRTNPDGTKTQMRYKGGAKNDWNNYEEVQSGTVTRQ